MKKLLLLIHLLAVYGGFGQCPYAAALESSDGHCLGTVLHVSSTHAFSKIVWYQGNTVAGTATATTSFSQTGIVVAGGHGNGIFANQLGSPLGIFVDSADNLYAADDNGYITEWTPGEVNRQIVAGNNGYGVGLSQLDYAWAVFVDKSGNIYVSDHGNQRVMEWAPGATSGTIVAGGHGGGQGAEYVPLPVGLYVACNGDLYVTDQDNNRVQKWAPGATAGVTVAGDNGAGPNANQLYEPSAIGMDGAGNLYILDGNNDRVQKWAPGATSGITVIQGQTGSNPDQPSRLLGMFVDYAGDVYLSSEHSPLIQEWTPGATSGTTVVTGYSAGLGPEYLCLFVDNRGNLYAGDGDSSSVFKYERQVTIDTSFTPTVPGIYYAVATDINGQPVTTDTILIKVPPGPTSLQISASATSVPVCTPLYFTATPVNPGDTPFYQWQVSGVNVGGDSLQYSNNIFANGDQVYCILNTVDGCTGAPVKDTSNTISLTIDPQGHASVTIAASDTVICDGTPITFKATVMNGAAAPVFQWLVNGAPIGDSTAAYTDSNPVSGDVVYCLITSDDVCGLAKSNSIPITVNPVPSVAAGQVFNIVYGQSQELDPVITGNIASYAWTPGAGLSDSTIRDPVADPARTTVYTLNVVADGGCKASGVITVDVYIPLSIPNAFTPNGDGHNDILYVLGGPAGSQVREFNIYNRWGQSVFRVHDVAPGDRQYGWNGTIGGRPAPPGTYVYIVVLSLAGGQQQVYKGTVELIR